MEKILGFNPGTHVVAEVQRKGLVAGVLVEEVDLGVVMLVTHRQVVSDAASLEGDVRENLEAETDRRLRMISARKGLAGWLVASRKEMVDFLTGRIAAEIAAGGAIKEMVMNPVPVQTFIPYDDLGVVEDTAARNEVVRIENEVEGLDVDGLIEEFRKMGESDG